MCGVKTGLGGVSKDRGYQRRDIYLDEYFPNDITLVHIELSPGANKGVVIFGWDELDDNKPLVPLHFFPILKGLELIFWTICICLVVD